jgi:hypothetical protein
MAAKVAPQFGTQDILARFETLVDRAEATKRFVQCTYGPLVSGGHRSGSRNPDR